MYLRGWMLSNVPFDKIFEQTVGTSVIATFQNKSRTALIAIHTYFELTVYSLWFRDETSPFQASRFTTSVS